MKTRLSILTVLVLQFVMPASADDLTTEQKAFRADIMSFLKEEGFAPYLDENSLDFKKEGQLYWIDISEGSPFYIEFHRAGLSCEKDSWATALIACNKTNKTYKCAKAILNDDYVSFAVEMYCHSSEEFKYTFYKNIKALDGVYSAVQDYYADLVSSTSAPFSITSVDVANTDVEGNIITDYGSSIYSYQTQYLKPRIKCDVETAGTYEIFIKLITPDGTYSTGNGSPSGYSYSSTLTMEAGTHTYLISGWGAKTSGKWAAGTYRFEFYYDDELVGQKQFTVK